jgi:hypothetical protein
MRARESRNVTNQKLCLRIALDNGGERSHFPIVVAAVLSRKFIRAKLWSVFWLPLVTRLPRPPARESFRSSLGEGGSLFFTTEETEVTEKGGSAAPRAMVIIGGTSSVSSDAH